FGWVGPEGKLTLQVAELPVSPKRYYPIWDGYGHHLWPISTNGYVLHPDIAQPDEASDTRTAGDGLRRSTHATRPPIIVPAPAVSGPDHRRRFDGIWISFTEEADDFVRLVEREIRALVPGSPKEKIRRALAHYVKEHALYTDYGEVYSDITLHASDDTSSIF